MSARLSFTRKLQLFILLLVTFLVISLAGIFFSYLLYSVGDSFFGVSKGFAYYLIRTHDLSGAIAHNTLPAVEKQIAAHLEMQEEILYAGLINHAGEVVMDTTGGDLKVFYQKNREKPWLTLKGQDEFFFLRDVRLRNKRFDVANICLPIYQQGKIWGAALVGVSANYLFQYALPRTIVFTALLLAVFLLTTSVLLWRLLHHLFRPVRELIETAGGLFEQNFEIEVPVNGDDEIGQLAETFNRLSAYLKDFVSRLQGQAVFEPVTHCYTETFFKKQLGTELERSQRFSDPLCAGWVEIANYGELAPAENRELGRKLQLEFADLLRKATRRIDVLAHLEGARFGVIFPKTGTDGALVVMERLQSLLQKTRFTVGRSMVPLSFALRYGLIFFQMDRDAPLPSAEVVLKQAESLMKTPLAGRMRPGEIVAYPIL